MVFSYHRYIHHIFSFLLILLLSSVGSARTPGLRFESITQKDGLSHSDIYAITQDLDGFLWFGSSDGLNRYDGYDMVVYRNSLVDPNSISDNVIRSLLCDKAGDIWIGTISGGVNRLDKKTNTFERFIHLEDSKKGLSNNACLSLASDNMGNIWVNHRSRCNYNKSILKSLPLEKITQYKKEIYSRYCKWHVSEYMRS